jgi:hypothetical protein
MMRGAILISVGGLALVVPAVGLATLVTFAALGLVVPLAIATLAQLATLRAQRRRFDPYSNPFGDVPSLVPSPRETSPRSGADRPSLVIRAGAFQREVRT